MAQTLGTVVAFIDDPAALRAELARLGARHRSYGAAPVHYAMVGEALLHTLQARTPDGLSAAACSACRSVP